MNALEKLKIELEEAKNQGVITNNCEAKVFTLGFIAGIINQKNEDWCNLTDKDIDMLKKLGVSCFNKNFYFTFGSDTAFPYQNGYLIVKAEGLRQAQVKFKKKYPNREGSCWLNCAFYYTEEMWNNETSKYYESEEPFEVIE